MAQAGGGSGLPLQLDGWKAFRWHSSKFEELIVQLGNFKRLYFEGTLHAIKVQIRQRTQG